MTLNETENDDISVLVFFSIILQPGGCPESSPYFSISFLVIVS